MSAAVTKAPKRRLSVILVTLSIILGIVGALASIGGFSSVKEQVGYRKATGEITSVDWKKNEGAKARTNMRCSPVVEFEVDGQTYTHGPDQYYVFGSDSDCKYQSGDSIEVRYNPSDPSEATVSDSTFDWLMGMIGAAVAIGFGLIAPLRMILKSTKPEAATSSPSAYNHR